MASPHEFGGKWTEEKLGYLKDYLVAYMTIFSKNPRALKLKTIYVDAFAGTGYRTLPKDNAGQLAFPLPDEDTETFKKGSAWIALEIEPGFSEYVFIDLDQEHVKELKKLLTKFPQKAEKIRIEHQEANSFLRTWCAQHDWRYTRAVMFLDPYGMSVDWPTLEAIARTGSIDLWVLFPLGPINRFLTRSGPPDEKTASQLTRIFGTESWKDEFYKKKIQQTLFGPRETVIKDADFDAIGDFFVQRLKTIFPGVAENPRPLFNSKNVPIFLLCFASANPKHAKIAIRIAGYLLGRKSWPLKRR